MIYNRFRYKQLLYGTSLNSVQYFFPRLPAREMLLKALNIKMSYDNTSVMFGPSDKIYTQIATGFQRGNKL